MTLPTDDKDRGGIGLSFVIPVLNEASALAAVIVSLKEVASRLGTSCETLVVDGGSADGSPEEARLAGARVLEDRGGYAASVLHGLREARGEFVLVLDGDGSHNPTQLPGLWSKRHGADLIIGSRFIEGGSTDVALTRLILTRVLNLFFWAVLRMPARDCSSGYRLYRRSLLGGLSLTAKGFEFQQDILLALLERGARVEESPISYRWRKAGDSKARPLALALALAGVLVRRRFGLFGIL
ncbi:MAG: glycosyltransferase [Elusimicrobiota bacterium]